MTGSTDRGAYRMVLLATLVTSVGSGMTFPYLIVYVHDALGASLVQAGAVAAAAGAVALAGGAIGGIVGDRIGARKILLAAMLVTACGTGCLALARNPLEAGGAAAIQGAGNAMAWASASSLLAELVASPQRHRAYAVRFGTINAGMGTGGLIAGAVVSLSHPGTFQALYAVDATTSVLAAVVVWAGTLEIGGTAPVTGAGSAPRPSYTAILADRRFLAYLGCTALLVTFGYGQMESPWPAFVTGVVRASPEVVGAGFAANTFLIVLAQLGAARLSRKWRRSRTLALTGLAWSAAWALGGLAGLWSHPTAAADTVLVGSLAVFALGEVFLSPVIGALPNELARDGLRVSYNAWASTVWSAGNLVGPPIGGVLLGSRHPYSWVAVSAAGAALAAAAALALARGLPAEIDRPAVTASL